MHLNKLLCSTVRWSLPVLQGVSISILAFCCKKTAPNFSWTETVFSSKRPSKCSQTFTSIPRIYQRHVLSAGGSYLHFSRNKAQKSGRCTGLQCRQSSLGIKINLFFLVPHTVKQSQLVSAESSFSLIFVLPAIIRY